MPTLEEHQSQNTVKLLLLGVSGDGKTGSLATLAKDYTVFIADFDNGLDILKDQNILPKELHKKVFFQSFYDKTKILANRPVMEATGITNLMSFMGDWKENGKIYGGGYTLGGRKSSSSSTRSASLGKCASTASWL